MAQASHLRLLIATALLNWPQAGKPGETISTVAEPTIPRSTRFAILTSPKSFAAELHDQISRATAKKALGAVRQGVQKKRTTPSTSIYNPEHRALQMNVAGISHSCTERSLMPKSHGGIRLVASSTFLRPVELASARAVF